MESSVAPTEGGGRGDAREAAAGEGDWGGGRLGCVGRVARGENLYTHFQPHRPPGAPGHRTGQYIPAFGYAQPAQPSFESAQLSTHKYRLSANPPKLMLQVAAVRE